METVLSGNLTPPNPPMGQEMGNILSGSGKPVNPTAKLYADLYAELKSRDKDNNNRLNFYREYTEGIITNLKGMSIVDSQGRALENIEVFFGNPERAVAKITETKNLRLPVVSLSIVNTQEDVNRRRPDFNVVMERQFDAITRRATRVVSLAPKAINLMYRINLWAKYIEDINQLSEQIENKFRPSLPIRTSFGKDTPAFIAYSTDQSTLTAGDRQDRIVQKAFTVNVEGYLPQHKYLLASNGKIKSLIIPTELT
jgi:hypothetical protein